MPHRQQLDVVVRQETHRRDIVLMALEGLCAEELGEVPNLPETPGGSVRGLHNEARQKGPRVSSKCGRQGVKLSLRRTTEDCWRFEMRAQRGVRRTLMEKSAEQVARTLPLLLKHASCTELVWPWARHRDA